MRERYRCAKQVVKAVLQTIEGQNFIGYNDILVKVTECPRAGMASGDGYELCKSECNQVAHAEVDAVAKALSAGAELSGSTLYLYGHTYCCTACQAVMYHAGVESYFINEQQFMLEEAVELKPIKG